MTKRISSTGLAYLGLCVGIPDKTPPSDGIYFLIPASRYSVGTYEKMEYVHALFYLPNSNVAELLGAGIFEIAKYISIPKTEYQAILDTLREKPRCDNMFAENNIEERLKSSTRSVTLFDMITGMIFYEGCGIVNGYVVIRLGS